jgi:tetratricopeptide (TPR) repeat protein
MVVAPPNIALVFLVLLIVGGAVYAGHFDNSFQFDDFHSIVENPSIRSFGSWRSWFTDLTAFSVLPENLNYRPLLLATYAASYRLSGLEPWGFHLLNWMIHVAVSFLVYAIALRLFAYPGVHPFKLESSFGLYPPNAAGMALIAALIYLVHPLTSEPVNYISSRSESLATLFVLLAFFAAIERHRALAAGPGPQALGFAALAAMAFAAGLLTKEIAITFPALVALHDLVLARQAGERRLPPGRTLAFYGVLAAITVVYLLIRAELIPPAVAAARSSVSRTTYFFTQLRAWLHYLGEFVWPARLTADNTDFGWSTGPGDPRVQLAAVLLVAIALSVAAGLRRNRLYAFGMLWFIITLLPTSSIFPLAEPVNGHRPYLAAVGLTMAAVAAVFALACRPGRLGELGRQGGLGALLGAAGVLLVLGTVERTRVWDSPRSLWSDVVAKSPGNGRAHMNLGLALMRDGDLDGAARHYDLAVGLAPSYALAYVNRGILRRARGDSAGAMADIKQSLRLGQDNIFVCFWAGKLYAEAGNLALAAEQLERARAVSPRHVESLRLLMDVEARRGQIDRLPELLADLESLGLATDEDRSTTAYHLLRAGRNQAAVPILEDLVGRSPGDLQARFNLGYAYLGLGRNADAEREFKLLVAREPGNRPAWQNLLWIHRVSGDEAAFERTAAEMARALGESAPPAGEKPRPAGSLRASLPARIEVPAPFYPQLPADTARHVPAAKKAP